MPSLAILKSTEENMGKITITTAPAGEQEYEEGEVQSMWEQ